MSAPRTNRRRGPVDPGLTRAGARTVPHDQITDAVPDSDDRGTLVLSDVPFFIMGSLNNRLSDAIIL